MNLINKLLFLLIISIHCLQAMDAPPHFAVDFDQSLSACKISELFPHITDNAADQSCPNKSIGVPAAAESSFNNNKKKPELKNIDPQPVKRKKKSTELFCPVCQNLYSFSDPMVLKIHILAAHTDLKPYICKETNCNFTCANPRVLQKHAKNKHRRTIAFPQLSLEMQRKVSAVLARFLTAWEFKCNICDGLFHSAHSLFLHQYHAKHQYIPDDPAQTSFNA